MPSIEPVEKVQWTTWVITGWDGNIAVLCQSFNHSGTNTLARKRVIKENEGISHSGLTLLRDRPNRQTGSQPVSSILVLLFEYQLRRLGLFEDCLKGRGTLGRISAQGTESE